MISCPNCGKSIADDAAHCGHCGHKIEQTTSQKTMMGFALSPEDLQKAIQEAGQRRESQPAAAESRPQELPIDELARTEILPSIEGNPALSDTLDPDADVGMNLGQGAAESAFSGFATPSNVSEVVAEPADVAKPSGFGGPSVQDPFAQPASSAAPAIQSMAPMQSTNPENEGGEESFVAKNKKLLIIAGAVAAVLMSCCVIGMVVKFVLPMFG